MAAEKNRPYAAVGNVMDVLARFRNRNLPEEFDDVAMRTAGVPEGMIGRTLAALRFLGLLNEANEPTDEWRALADMDDVSFPEGLGRLVRAAYADTFIHVSPETDTQDRVRQAFQQYQPKSQIDRMVTLFLGLCAESGIPTRDAPKRRLTKAQQGEEVKRKPRPVQGTPVASVPVQQQPPPNGGETKRIELRGGGSLTLHASTRFFELSKTDREFVFELLDKLTEYESQRLLQAPRVEVAVEDQRS